jgi:hypothetical protein
MHLGPEPIAGNAVNLDLTAGHLSADVPSSVAVDVDRPSANAMTDVMDASQIPLDINPSIGRIARDGEQIRQRQPLVPMLDLELFDLSKRFGAYLIRDHILDLDWDKRFRVIAQF